MREMLVTVQLPFTDARHFLPCSLTGQLPLVSSFTELTPGEDFIRAFGPLRKRHRGGVSAWPGEELYANAARALRVVPFGPVSAEDIINGVFRLPRGNPRVAFRRLMSDGTATTRVETGIRVDPWDVAVDSVVAAVLEIHIDKAAVATMNPNNRWPGPLPNSIRMRMAIRRCRFHRCIASATMNPPINRKIT